MRKYGAFQCTVARKQLFSSCPMPLEPSTPSSSSSASQISHKDYCFRLADDLISRGLLSSAQKVIHRLIFQSASISEAVSAADIAISRGKQLDLVSYGYLIRKIVISGEPKMAEELYMNFVINNGLLPDRNLLNSMIICYCKLGKLEEAKSCFDSLIQSKRVPWVGSCNAIVKSLSEPDRILEAYDCFCEISDASNMVLHFSCYNRLINGLCLRGFIDNGLHVFDVMIEHVVSPTIHVCKSLIIGLCKWGRVEEAVSLSTQIESLGFVVDEFMHTLLINTCCKVRKMKTAMMLFMRMLKLGYETDNYTYNTLIHGFFKLGSFHQGKILLDMMVNSGLNPNVVTNQIMLNMHCRHNQLDCALMLLNDTLAPNVHCFTPVLSALFKAQKFEDMSRLYYRMLDNGVVPDHVLFFSLAKNKEADKLYFALQVLKAIANKSSNTGIESKPKDVMVEIECLLEEITKRNPILADTGFNIYMIALCLGGKLEEAHLCMEKMLRLGILPSITAFNSFMKLLTREGRMDSVNYLLEVMQDEGLIPNQATVAVIVDELCKQGNSKSAMDVLSQIKEEGIKPTVAIYDSIIGCLGRQRMVGEAENLFYDMLEFGIDPDETIFVTMINAYSKNGLARAACQLFDKMTEYKLRPNSYAYTALIPGLVKKNMTEKGGLYLDRMMKDGFMPNEVLYTSLINQYFRKKEFEFAFRLVRLMEKRHLEIDLVTYVTLVSGVSRNIRLSDRKWYFLNGKSEKGKEILFRLLSRSTFPSNKSDLKHLIDSQGNLKRFALTLIEKIGSHLVVPNLYLCNGILSLICWAKSTKEAYEHLNLMQREGVYPNDVTFTILIDRCVHSGQINDAVKLFNKIHLDGLVPDRLAYNTLIRGFCNVGRIVDALSLSQMMQKRGFLPSKSSYEMILSSLCDKRWSSLALRICEEMICNGYSPSHYNLHRLFSVLLQDEKLDEISVMRATIIRKLRNNVGPYVVVCEEANFRQERQGLLGNIKRSLNTLIDNLCWSFSRW